MSDQDLIKKLELLAHIATEGTEFAPDEHIAGIAAERIAELEAENKKARRTSEYWKAELNAANKQLARLEAFRSAVIGWRENDWPHWFCRATAERVAERGTEALNHQEQIDG